MPFPQSLDLDMDLPQWNFRSIGEARVERASWKSEQ